MTKIITKLMQGLYHNGMFCKTLLFLIVSAISALLCSSAYAATAPWPVPSVMHKISLQSNWSSVRDITGDQNGNLDISSHGADGATGDWDSVYYWSDGSNMFFRVLLSANPLKLSQGNWIFENNTSHVIQVDSNKDNATDWILSISKATTCGQLNLYQGGTLVTGFPITFASMSNAVDPSVWISNSVGGDNFARVTDTGTTNPGTSVNMHYLDIQAPLSWFNSGTAPITASTLIRPFAGTSAQPNNINKDYMYGSSLDFNAIVPIVAGDPNAAPGAMYDTRDTSAPAAISSAGTWNCGADTVAISGYGWPSSANLTARIYSPDNLTQHWSGTVISNAVGDVTSASTWAIPTNTVPGTYRLKVDHPIDFSVNQYDTFQIACAQVAGVSVTPATATGENKLPGSSVTHAFTVQNTGNGNDTFNLSESQSGTAGSWTWTIYVDDNCDGVKDAGETTVASNTGSLGPGGTKCFTSTASVSGANTQTNTHTVTATSTFNGAVSGSSQKTATVQTPVLSLSKASDKANAAPSEVVTYTMDYSNTGGAAAQSVIFLDTVPSNTTYVQTSASGAGATIEYSHNGGGAWDSSDAAPVTDIRWTLSSPLSPGGSGSFSFQVTVN